MILDIENLKGARTTAGNPDIDNPQGARTTAGNPVNPQVERTGGAPQEALSHGGVLVMDKPQGWTSHDVVAHVKRKLKARKVGHLGTLDPLATGVLVLVINGATKYSSQLDTGAKEYLTVARLGEETDTYDSEGKVIATSDVSAVTGDAVNSALSTFMGRIEQVPPMYSAIKSSGTPLYKLARKGLTVERQARQIEVYSLEVTRVELPEVEFRVLCSRGTYVRSICHDLGKLLGTGAHMAELRRTASGGFSSEEAALPGLSAEELSRRVVPLEDALRRAGVASLGVKA
ncbi:tRNA pseudouridine synthase B [Anaerolineae bacterium]|nr:tRNA pseudouridine synthase B [Anaerolineae bacterium]